MSTKKTFTLQLYMGSPDDHPCSTITLSTGAKISHAYVCTEGNSDLFEVPNGTNPRDLDPDSPRVKEILKTLQQKTGFAVYNGGICILIDDDSFHCNTRNSTIQFSCNDKGTGHYDGQHTREAIAQAQSSAQAEGQQFQLFLVPLSVFNTPQEVRVAAECWNRRSGQKAHSVANQRGDFDVLKRFLSPTALGNIQWKENGKNTAGVIPQKECRIDRVLALLYTASPVLRSSYLSVGDMYGFHKRGWQTTKIVDPSPQHAARLQDFEKLYPLTEPIMKLADYIQDNLEDFYDKGSPDWECEGVAPSFGDLTIVRTATKKDLQKDMKERKPMKQMLFNTTSVKGALLPEYIQPIMHGLMKVFLQRTRSGVKLSAPETEIRAFWEFACCKVLNRMDQLFVENFTQRFNSRHAEFGEWDFLWDEVLFTVQECHAQHELWRPPAVQKAA